MKILEKKKQNKSVDLILIAIVLALTVVGVVFIAYASAQPFTGEESSMAEYLGKFDFGTIGLHLLRTAVGMAMAVAVMLFDYEVLGSLSKVIYIGSIVLLIIVLGMGSTIRGAKAWLRFGGFNVQPSELIKLTVIVIVSKVAADACEKDGRLKRFTDVAKTLLLPGALVALVIAQRDLGTAFVYICIIAGILFAAKLSWKVLASIATVGVGGFAAAYFFAFEDWQRDRIRTFLYPDTDVMGAEYNVANSKIVIGSGQWGGKGIFSDGSLVQLGFLPEHTTDFIFASGVEAFGFVGGMIVILLYAALLVRVLIIAARARDFFGAFICVGVASMFFAHIFENIGMVMGVMPVTGIPLPFISYGGSNFLTNMIAMGLVLNVGMRKPTKHYNVKT